MENIEISKVYKFKLEIKESKIQKFGIGINQYDSVIFKISVTENEIAKILTGCNVSILVAKEDGVIERQTHDITITNAEEGCVDVYLNKSCVDTLGVCMAQLVISDDNESIRSSKFLFIVNEIIDGEFIEEANNEKISIFEDLEKKLDDLYKDTENNIDILNEKIANYGDLFSGDYNDLFNKPEIPVVDVDKKYVDEGLGTKADYESVYFKDEVYNKNEIHEVLDESLTGGIIDLGSYLKKLEAYEYFSVLGELLELKVEKEEGKTLSSNDFTDEFLIKVISLENYIHPNDSNTRHISDAERLYWNDKADNKTVSSSSNGLMTPALKTKLDGVASYANNYTHPSTHPASIIVQDKSNRFVTDSEKEAWNELIDKVDNILSRLQALENK